MLESVDKFCPYCNEAIELVIDCSVTNQIYIEDCQVCCRPIVVTAEISLDSELDVSVKSEDD